MKDRIKQIMESMKMTQQDFSKFLGQSTATVSAVFTGRTAPSMRLVEAIKKKIPNLSYDWLLDGVGPMYVDQVKQVAENEPVAVENSFDMRQASQDVATPPINGNVVPQRRAQEYGQQVTEMKIVDNKHRRITEIRVYFDDGYNQVFLPEKQI